MFMIFTLNYIYDMSMFHLCHPHSFCSRCYGNSRSSCSSCIGRWRPWQYPCYAAVAVAWLVVVWVSIAPSHVHSHPQPPPVSLCLRNPWVWLHRIPAANHASPLVSQRCLYSIIISMFNHFHNDIFNTGCPCGLRVKILTRYWQNCPPKY